MKLLLLILGVVVVVLNLFLWSSKRQARKAKADESSYKGKKEDSNTRSIEFLDNPEVAPLKQSAAAELGISIEQLNRLSVEEIEDLAAKKGLI